MNLLEIVWRLVEYLLVAFGASVFWILEHDKEKAVLTKILFGFIDKNKHTSKKTKLGLIKQLAKACKLSGVDIARYADAHIEKNYADE